MPFISLKQSPSAPAVNSVRIQYREAGSGFPLIFLHGGWGYEVYPFDRQIEAFGDRFRIIIPDRSGYGQSPRLGEFPADFHRRAAGETMNFMDALGIARAVLWGHSDGAVISAMIGLASPERAAGLILEAFHLYRAKPGSAEFFERMANEPDLLGERVTGVLSREHGEDYWRDLIITNGRAWLRIAEESAGPKEDLYGGKLSGLKAPALFIHGGRDPRTEPDEMDSLRKELPRAEFHIIEEAGHSPHSERASADECNRRASEFLQRIQDSGEAIVSEASLNPES